MTNGDDSRNPTFKLRENFTGTVENLNTYLSVSRYSYKSYMQDVISPSHQWLVRFNCPNHSKRYHRHFDCCYVVAQFRDQPNS